MAVIPDFKAATIIPFLTQHIEPGSTIYTDGLKSFAGLTEAGFKHVARTQPLRSELRKVRSPSSHLQTGPLGTFNSG
jgi:transposase-like protein